MSREICVHNVPIERECPECATRAVAEPDGHAPDEIHFLESIASYLQEPAIYPYSLLERAGSAAELIRIRLKRLRAVAEKAPAPRGEIEMSPEEVIETMDSINKHNAEVAAEKAAPAAPPDLPQALHEIGEIALRGKLDNCPDCGRRLGYIFYVNEVRQIILRLLGAATPLNADEIAAAHAKSHYHKHEDGTSEYVAGSRCASRISAEIQGALKGSALKKK